MAGERLAKITIEASWAIDDYIRGEMTTHQRVRLGGVWINYYRGAYSSQHQFVVPDPDDVGRDYVLQGVQGLLALIKLDIKGRGLPYVVSETRDLGNDLSTNWPRIAFDIEATTYDDYLDLDFSTDWTGSPPGWRVTNQRTLAPLIVTVSMTPAGVFGSATGSIYLVAFAAPGGPNTFRWADTPLETTNARQALEAGTYRCTVTRTDGVSALVVVQVTSDTQLQVLVTQTESTAALVVSGGLPPYAYAWDDGPTTAERTQLSAGTYYCLVSDARGAQQRVKVELAAYRYFWSRNPVEISLDAGDDYRLDPTTKPQLSFVLEVWVEVVYLSGTFVQVGPQLEQPADPAGRTTFDVAALLDAFLSEHLPAPTGFSAERADSLFRRWYARTGEKYGDPVPIAGVLGDQQQHYVLLGGLSQEQAAAGTWFGYQAAVLPFLTWDLNPQMVLPQQPVYLYYQHLSEQATFLLWQRVRLADGTSGPALNIATQYFVRRFEVYCLHVGPAELALVVPEVSGYDLWVTDVDGNFLSEVRSFLLNRAYYPQQRFFLYTNSLGGVNCLAAVGEASHALDVAATEADRARFDALLGDVATLSRTGTPTLSVATGSRRRAQLVADQELLLSRRVTLVSGGQRWTGRVKPASYVIKDESQGLASLSFDFILARQQQFSPRLPAVAAGQVIAPIRGGEGAQP